MSVDQQGDLVRWLEARTAGAPPVLRERVLEHAAAVTESMPAPERLALASERVLAIVEEHPGDRSVALDLLAADALITLTLLAQAEAAPAELGSFAERLLAAERVV
ncbi:MAG TPA: hypothetical protein VG817_10775 [Gemmatimonadales bacterium]|nr:hypothetical protein [Gemmatimonadales bacterium]